MTPRLWALLALPLSLLILLPALLHPALAEPVMIRGLLLHRH